MRHSGARTCSIDVTDRGVTVRDDGRGVRGGVRGNGLTGLAHRLEDAGGGLTIDSDATGTALIATLREAP